MKKSLYAVLILILFIMSFVGGYRFNQSANSDGSGHSGDREILHYVDPMNPANTSKEPGIAPCGMPMEPVYADEVDGGTVLGLPAGVIKLNENKRQLIGVQSGEVALTSESVNLRVLGKITPDENKIYALVSGTDGWMGEIHESTTGSIVRKGQLMGKIRMYDYDFYTWQQRYLTELGNAGRRRVYISPLSGMAEEVERAARARRESGALLPDPGAPISFPGKDKREMHDGMGGNSSSVQPMESPQRVNEPESKINQPESPTPPTAWGIPPGTLYYGEGKQPSRNPDDIMADILREKNKIPELPDGPTPEMPDATAADLPMELAKVQPGPDSGITGAAQEQNDNNKSSYMAETNPEMDSRPMAMETPPVMKEQQKSPMAFHDHASMSAPPPSVATNDAQNNMVPYLPKEAGSMSPAVKGKNPPHQKSGKHYFTGEDDILYVSKARQELLDLGVSDAQLEELADTGVYVTSIQLHSPVDGLILSRNVTSRQKIDRGQECFRIADVSTIWVEAEVFDIEERLLPPGTIAKVSLPNLGEYRMAKVTKVLPYFSENSRILKVRLELENSDFRFRPDMFVDVEFILQLEPAITVPSSAIIDSGNHTVVYVVGKEGIFEPRTIVTGWRFNDRVQVIEGLTPGEKIVVSGNFLIDSESRMKLAAARLMDDNIISKSAPLSSRQPGRSTPTVTTQFTVPGQKVVDPVCGMGVDAKTAVEKELTAEYNGQTYYFCSEECLDDFYRHGPKIEGSGVPIGSETGPMHMSEMGNQQMTGNGNTMEKPMPEISADKQNTAKDPVCTMDVDIEQAISTNLKSEYQGQTYYFCSSYCKDIFEKSPLDFVNEQMENGSSGHEGHNHD